MAIDTESTIDYYVNLLIIQYNNKQKARKTIALHVDTLLQDNVVCEVQDAFNLDSAIGVQLDTIGKYVGVDRFFSATIPPSGDFFGMTTYSTLGSDTAVGMTDYANYNIDAGGFLDYEDLTRGGVLDDDEYRTILKLRIVQNNSDHSDGSIDDGLFGFFGDALVMSDKLDMTMTYFFDGIDIRLAVIALVKEVLPRPMGVRLNGLIERSGKIFGFTNYTKTIVSEKVTGFTNYIDGFTKEGEILNYNKIITV